MSTGAPTPGKQPLHVIAVEEHFLTAALRDAVLALEPELRDDVVAALDDDVSARLSDLGDARIAEMDRAGVDVQVLSLVAPGVQSLDAATAVPLARASNDLLAQTVRSFPDRFQALAAVATPDPRAAAAELRRCVLDLGFAGAMLHGRTRTQNLDHPALRPVLREAAELGVPLHLHPQIPVRAVRAQYYDGFDPAVGLALATGGWGWHVETGVQALRLILSGVFDEHPTLQVVLGHWGELLASFIRRVDSVPALARGLEHPVAEYLRRNVYLAPSGILEPTYLRDAIEVVGVDRVLFSTDHPFVPVPDGGARRFLQEAPLSQDDREKIAHGNWERLTGVR